MTKKEEVNDLSGLGVAFAFILVAIFIYLTPDYLGSYWISTIVSSFLVICGVIGLGTELDKLNNSAKKNSIGFNDLGVGLGFFIFWAVLYYNFQSIWLNYLILLLLFIGTYGICAGLAKITQNIFSNDSNTKKAISVPVRVFQITATLITIYEVLTKLKIID